MPLELNLLYPDPGHLSVRLGDESSATLPFTSPLTDADQQDLRWYLEIYAGRYTTDVDDARAARFAARLSQLGQALFQAVFADRVAQRLFNAFQDSQEAGRLLTVSAVHPEILSLPWELLRDPSGTFLVHEAPRLTIRRRLPGATGGRPPLPVQPKPQLRLLFVVSRPTDAPFIDPRSDPLAVLAALDQKAPGRVEVEFLRPATLQNLVDRLENDDLPPVDILHFDGHGVFDRTGVLSGVQGVPVPTASASLRQDELPLGANTGYLYFEQPDGTKDPVSAPELGDMLHRRQVGLVVLSACQSAALGGDEPLGSVAARLTAAGLPAVIAMTYSVLVATTRELFGEFYRQLAGGRGLGEALDAARRRLYANPDRHEVQRGAHRVPLRLTDWFVPALYQVGWDAPLLTKAGPEAAPAEPGPARHNLPPPQEAGFFGRSPELWDLERWFVTGTRRISLTGFGGMGKTCLAQEAGRWLGRTGLFEAVAFVSYADFQGVDPVGLAVSTLAAVLGQNLLDAGAATTALHRTPTLLVLDNLEALAAGPRQELLDAALP